MTIPDFRDLTRYWRDHYADLRLMEQEYADQPLTAEEVDELGRMLLRAMDDVRAGLLHQFGLDYASEPPRRMSWARDPQSAREWVILAQSVHALMLWGVLFARIRDEAVPLPVEQRGPATLEILLWGRRRLYPFGLMLMQHGVPSRAVQHGTNLVLSGWAAAGVNLETAINLRQGIRPYALQWGVDDETALGLLLPAQAWLACEEMQTEPWDVEGVFGAIVNPLARVKERVSGRAVPLLEGQVVTPSAEHEFLARHNAVDDQRRAEEQAQILAALGQAAKLSPQQALIMGLYLERRETKQIAEELGIPVDQVDDQRKKARRKFRKFLLSPGVAERWNIPRELLG